MIRDGYILVISPTLVYLAGLLSGKPRLARAVAIFPFIIVRSREVVEPWLINHERIHFRQQIETLFIGLWILSILETLYAVVILQKSFAEAYILRSSEQEAYRHQNDPHYLQTRKMWSIFKYMRDKKLFTFGKPGEIIFTS